MFRRGMKGLDAAGLAAAAGAGRGKASNPVQLFGRARLLEKELLGHSLSASSIRSATALTSGSFSRRAYTGWLSRAQGSGLPRTGEELRSLESTANIRPQDARAQAAYLEALDSSGYATEVIKRVESGQFAVDAQVIGSYSSSLSKLCGFTGPANALQAGRIEEALQAAWLEHGLPAESYLDVNALLAARAGIMDRLANSGAGAAIPSWARVAAPISRTALALPAGAAAAAPSPAATAAAAGAGAGGGLRTAGRGFEDAYFGSAPVYNPAMHAARTAMPGYAAAPPAYANYYASTAAAAPAAAAGGYYSPAAAAGYGPAGFAPAGYGAAAAAGVSPALMPAAAQAGAASNLGTAANPLIIEAKGGQQSWGGWLMRTLLSAGIFAGAIYFFTSRGNLSELTGGGKVTESTEIPSTRFKDVRGVDEAKHELQDVVNFLRDPEKYRALGAKVPRGVLLTGPPGTGKTLLARAVAGEAGCQFYAKSASEFEEMLVGLGAKRIRDLFNDARKNAPSIIFIDEIDAIGGKRKVSVGGNHERQTLNQLLSSMDGFTKNENVIVIAATNAPSILDPALTRPGRFDTSVNVPLPDIKGRKEILELYLAKVVVDKGIDAELLARATPGFSGAQLEAMINSAALMAANRGASMIEMSDLEEARDKLIMGPARKSFVKKPDVMRNTAYHEGGHTLTALLTKGSMQLHKVTILPRGFSGGAAWYLPNEEGTQTREEILAQIDVAMGGRAAEELIFGKDRITTGAGMDLSTASDLARKFCTVYAMSDLGLSSYSNGEKPSQERQAAIDAEVEKILSASYARVYALLRDNRDKLDRLATALLQFETLTAEECKRVVAGEKLDPMRDGSLIQQAKKTKKEEEEEKEGAGDKSKEKEKKGKAAAAAAAGGKKGGAAEEEAGAGSGKKKSSVWA